MENSNNDKINHVSDTAFWVAAYRARETDREDALFKDPLAKLLTTDKGSEFADRAIDSKFVYWTVIIRTYVIDILIQNAIAWGIDTIINLGAGLDTRPYRMALPKTINWIEVDHPHLTEFKSEKLKDEKSNCILERIPLDLSDKEARRQLFSEVNSQAKKVLVLTEGVIPYLSEDEVASLAEDIQAQSSFTFWITEYHSKEMYRHLQKRKKSKELENAPFKFFPDDWFSVFNKRGFTQEAVVYLVDEAEKLGRPFPLPWWAKLLHLIIPAKEIDKFRKMSGYILFKPNGR